jgi:hypothetical protein
MSLGANCSLYNRIGFWILNRRKASLAHGPRLVDGLNQPATR